MKVHKVIGLMSGTSLDGLDIAYCEFHENDKWHYELGKCTTINYPEDFKQKLQNCMQLDKEELDILDKELGKYWGLHVQKFIDNNDLEVDFISSHGHTVFHQPDKGITVQIGSAQAISKICNKTVVYGFRTKDVELGGQGAPLVPIGDKLLFPEYHYCLNLGGISNVSFDDEIGIRRAFDISPCNLVLNHYANKRGLEFDDSGNIGRSGKVNTSLLNNLNEVEYYKIKGPKSLGKESIVNEFIPLLDSFEISLEDKMRTFYEHISIQIGNVLKNKNVLITGGGAFNKFLIELIKEKSNSNIIIPKSELISFKEAFLFAFLGVLRIENRTNILKSYTGASSDSCSGKIFS